MALYDLIVRLQKSPDNSKGIMDGIRKLSSKLHKGAHYETTENRVHNINLTKGLIQDHFVDKVPPVFGHGPSLALDFENALRRSRIESSRYEFKQGVLRLDQDRSTDNPLLLKIVETICGISNLGPDSEGYLFVGVADKEKDALRIEALDGVTARKVGYHYLVGIDREARVQGISLDSYVQKLISIIQNSALSEPLKTQVLSSFDTITLYGLTVIRITIPAQKEISFLGDKSFHRKGSNTVEIFGQQLLAVSKLFAK
jgi:hypothetical protein